MKRFLKAKLTPESKSFLMEEHCDNDDCFPLDWTSSNWNLLSAEGIGKLAGYELNQLKNALLAHGETMNSIFRPIYMYTNTHSMPVHCR